MNLIQRIEMLAKTKNACFNITTMGRILRALIHIQQSIFNLLVPSQCAGCGQFQEIFCLACQNKSYEQTAQCLTCGFRNMNGMLCTPQCKKMLFGAPDQIFWVGKYDSVLKKAVQNLKYKKRKEVARPLGKLLAKKYDYIVTRNAPRIPNDNSQYIVIPVPLHNKKLQERGFNQSEYIAQSFAKEKNLPIVNDILIKTVPTQAQVKTMNRNERLKNLEGAFSINASAFSPHRNKRIILIDDVATSGATLMHTSRTLRAAGAKRIIALVVAHG